MKESMKRREKMNELIKQTQGTISYDFESAKEKIRERLTEYKEYAFTEESKVYAKKDLASLRKEQKAFADRVREVKKEWMKPFEEFKAKADKLINLYDEPITLIDGQLKDFEEKRKAEKRDLINRIYTEELSELTELLPLERIYNSKWENATCKEKEIRTELHDIATKTAQSITTIKAMKSTDEKKAINLYLRTFDITQSINFINERAKVRADAIERERQRKIQEEEERIRREERERILAEQRHQADLKAAQEKAELEKQQELEKAKLEKENAVQEAKEEMIESFIPEFVGESNLYEYRISLTEDAKEKLETFMNSVGIEWEIING